MKFLATTLLISTLTFSSSHACYENHFLPKNSLRIPVGVKSQGGLTKLEFDEVLAKIEEEFSQEVRQNGYRFQVIRDWVNPEVNATAEPSGRLHFYGGLARHAAVTKDGFALAACHEVGHLIGGAPKFTGEKLSGEPQADYFGTLKCLRRIFLNDDNLALIKKKSVPKPVSTQCKLAHPNPLDQAICIRSTLAGAELGTFLAEALPQLGKAEIGKPDLTIVKKTLTDYPATNQCRLDTFMQGALCEKSFHEDVSQSDEVQGTCHPKTGETAGLRPLCWFKAKI